jgi:ferredoxin-type protein NapG
MWHDPNRSMNRRRFFREGLRELLRPLADSVENLAKAAEHFNKLDQPPAPRYEPPAYEPPRLQFVRPPGARSEEEFKSLCSRCGDCVRVCPAQCIKIDETGYNGDGAPYIDIDTMPCVMCDGLLCMHNCPTGALLPVPREQMNIGLAVWQQHMCLRTSGQECTICVDRCPVGAAAIEVSGGNIDVHAAGCTGCGVCQHACPTYPKSIVVTPKAQMMGG